MAWPYYLETVTVCDVLESGACIEGILDWIEENSGVISGAVDDDKNEYILAAACADGYGYGDGDGDGE